jgi:hypothetical protein
MHNYIRKCILQLILTNTIYYKNSKTKKLKKSIIETKPFYYVNIKKKGYVSLYNIFQNQKKLELWLIIINESINNHLKDYYKIRTILILNFLFSRLKIY